MYYMPDAFVSHSQSKRQQKIEHKVIVINVRSEWQER